MGMRIMKGSDIQIPGDNVILRLEMYQSGKVSLNAPAIDPINVCKILQNLVIDLMFGNFQPREHPKVTVPETGLGNGENN